VVARGRDCCLPAIGTSETRRATVRRGFWGVLGDRRPPQARPEPSIGRVPLKAAVHRSANLNDAATLQLVGEHARSFQIRQSSADECAGVRVGVIVEAADARACVERP
jgi:hypothetical protein